MNEVMMYLDAYPELKPYIAMGIAMTVLLAPFHFIMGFIRPPLSRAYDTVVKQCYREISIYVADPEYAKFNLWLDKNAKFTTFKRQFKVVAGDGGDDVYSNTPPSKLVAGYGSVLVKAPGQPYVWVTRAKEENKNVFQQTETLTFRVFSLRQKPIFDLFDSVTEIKEEPGPFVYTNEGSWWSKIGKPKTVLPPIGDGAAEFMADVEQFLKEEDEYKSRGVAYKRGYLLYGPPGTGKTSILSYVSNHFDMNIYMMDSMGITNFMGLAHDVKKKSMILIEDIDMTIAGHGRKNTLSKATTATPVSDNEVEAEEAPDEKKNPNECLRDFLNTLDGIVQFDGAIVVITTNKPSVLDAALLRPGRIDVQIEIGILNSDQQIEHFNRFFKTEAATGPVKVRDRTFAELQYICSSNMKDPETAWEKLMSDS